MIDFSVEDFKEVKSLVGKLPPMGDKVLNVIFLNKILEELKSKDKVSLTDLTNDTLRKICKDKKIDDKNLKTKEDLINAILG